MREKRGLSAVVTTLIIILLVIVSVGIIWVVVRNVIEQGAEQIELGRFTLDLEIKSVQIEEGNNVTVVVVKRNPGKGNIIGMNFIFSDGKESEIIREDILFKELDEKSFTFILTKINTENLETVSVAPIYELSSGKESMGDIADAFDIKKGGSIATGEAIEGNFAGLGYSGVGMVEYGPFSSGVPKLPEFRKAIVDPLDVLPGDNQTFTVHVYSPSGVINVTSITELDNSTSNLIFLKVGGYEESGETIEIWAVTWIVNDVHAITYRTTITATDTNSNENSITLTWTDSCRSDLLGKHGAAYTITSSCSTGTNQIGGLDGGVLTIQSGVTVTIDSGATWGFNSGQSIKVEGTITVTGEIRKGNIFMFDADGDGYTLNFVHAFSTASTLTDYTRAKDIAILSDCDDGDGTRWRLRYADADSDTYFSSALSCVGNHAAQDSTGNDCCDSASNVHPDQASWFSTAISASGCTANYDYNCVSGDQKRYTGVNGDCDTCDTILCGMFVCCTDVAGSVGYTAGSTPACGASANYISGTGNCALDATEFDCAPGAPVDCNPTGSARTQQCH